jgi:hypothetical protein
MKLKKNIALSESGFIFNPATGDSFTVNHIAAQVIEKMKDAKSPEEIKAELLDQYEVRASALEEDLHDFTTHLRQLGLLEL